MQINWTVLTYFVVGLFVLNGFFRGWWKEAITTAFLVLLVFFLRQPNIAQAFIDLLNTIFATIWQVLPDSLVSLLNNLLENGLGVRTAGRAIQANAGDPGAWLIILLLFIAAATLLGRSGLPNNVSQSNGHVYVVRPMGSVLGGLVGGLNGWLVINLVREYLDGRNLPGGRATLPTEITMAAEGPVRLASSGVSIQATDLPRFTVLDSFLPWIVIAVGLVIFLAALKNRIGLRTRDGFRKIDYRAPFGYRKFEIPRTRDRRIEMPVFREGG